MLKWVIIVIGFAALAIAMGLSGFGRTVREPAEATASSVASKSGETLEEAIYDYCIKSVERQGVITTENQADVETVCECAASDLSVKFEDTRPEDLQSWMQQDQARDDANDIVRECIDAAGLK